MAVITMLVCFFLWYALPYYKLYCEETTLCSTQKITRKLRCVVRKDYRHYTYVIILYYSHYYGMGALELPAKNIGKLSIL